MFLLWGDWLVSLHLAAHRGINRHYCLGPHCGQCHVLRPTPCLIHVKHTIDLIRTAVIRVLSETSLLVSYKRAPHG
jgi:hypothetical protein